MNTKINKKRLPRKVKIGYRVTEKEKEKLEKEAEDLDFPTLSDYLREIVRRRDVQ